MEIETQDNNVFDKANQKTVHFSDNIDIDIPVDIAVKQQLDAAKAKGRRRARTSSSGSKDEETVSSEAVPKPIAPSKLRKLGEKDRHISRTGKGRGKPKKGNKTNGNL